MPLRDDTKDRALALDAADTLRSFRDHFHVPLHEGRPVVYLCGNSLGLLPKTTPAAIQAELEEWQCRAVEGHFAAARPWFSYHKTVVDQLCHVVGAMPHEVVAMNSLTVNLHLLLTSFYRPTGTRTKILMAGREFPSDRYAIESHIRSRGLDPLDTMLELQPLPGAYTIEPRQVLDAIQTLGDSLALIMFSGVHFYTGELFDIKAITDAGHAVGAIVGFDLAHAVGNVTLQLHQWGPDFAVWCSYKYLNSGPGGVGGAFVHERHADSPSLNRLAGWWGNNETSRFAMEHGFVPTAGADGWQLSNAPVLSLAAHRSALDIHVAAGMHRLSAKRDLLTSLLWDVLSEGIGDRSWIRIITPSDTRRRGAQLSIHFDRDGKRIFDELIERGVIVDWRTPSVIRMAPAPLYCTFADVLSCGQIFSDIVSRLDP
jgi:kynureninase